MDINGGQDSQKLPFAPNVNLHTGIKKERISMSRVINRVGKIYGRLTVVSRNGSCASGAAWLCECSCGNSITVSANHLRTGHTKSCGCLDSETRSIRCTTHGFSSHLLYTNVYTNMKARCHNEKYHRYKDYGAKGIKVCDEWLNNPRSFYEWGITNGYKDTMHLHRKDKTKGYYPENCEFLDRLIHLRSHVAKLTEEQAKEIKYSKDGIKSLSKKFKISEWAIDDIRNGKTWRNV